VRNKLPEPHETGEITVPYILMFTFSDNKLKDKPFWAEIQQALPKKTYKYTGELHFKYKLFLGRSTCSFIDCRMCDLSNVIQV
jgi:hypothetical protein